MAVYDVCHQLPHLPLDKMAAILAEDVFKCIFLNENGRIPLQISLKIVPMSKIDNTLALVQVMTWYPISKVLYIWRENCRTWNFTR